MASEEFYNYILELSEASRLSSISSPAEELEKEILIRDLETVFQLLTLDFQELLELAASRGRRTAYLCVCARESRIKLSEGGEIPLQELFFPSEKLQARYRRFELQTLPERLREFLSPFSLRISWLSECGEFQALLPAEFQKAEVILVAVDWPEKKLISEPGVSTNEFLDSAQSTLPLARRK